MDDGPFCLQRESKSLALSPLIQGVMDVSSSSINIFVHPESTMHIPHLTEIITVTVLCKCTARHKSPLGLLSMANLWHLSYMLSLGLRLYRKPVEWRMSFRVGFKHVRERFIAFIKCIMSSDMHLTLQPMWISALQFSVQKFLSKTVSYIMMISFH